MTIKINLSANSFATHNEIITNLEEKVEIAFSSPIYQTDGLIIHVRKDNVLKPIKAKDGVVDVTEFCKSAGLVEMTATLEARGKAAKVWQIEPLVVTELPDGFAVVPELEAMRKEIETIKQALVEITKD